MDVYGERSISLTLSTLQNLNLTRTSTLQEMLKTKIKHPSRVWSVEAQKFLGNVSGAELEQKGLLSNDTLWAFAVPTNFGGAPVPPVGSVEESHEKVAQQTS